MPELPEIEIVRRDLEKEVMGRRIKDAEVRPGRNAMKVVPRHGRRKEFSDLLEGAKVEAVGRVGKILYLSLDNEHAMMVDLGPGAWLLKTSASEEMAMHTYVVVSFTIGGQLRLIDGQTRSNVHVAPTEELERMRSTRSFAVDPFETPLTWQHFSQLLQERDTTMKQLLMDQGFICGLGDIYSDEVLFTSGIRFDRSTAKLTSQDVRRLYRGMMETLQDAVRARGTTWGEQDFRDLHGEPGLYQLELKVFERDGEACRRCRQAIVKDTADGAFTYFCPQCQT